MIVTFSRLNVEMFTIKKKDWNSLWIFWFGPKTDWGKMNPQRTFPDVSGVIMPDLVMIYDKL